MNSIIMFYIYAGVIMLAVLLFSLFVVVCFAPIVLMCVFGWYWIFTYIAVPLLMYVIVEYGGRILDTVCVRLLGYPFF